MHRILKRLHCLGWLAALLWSATAHAAIPTSERNVLVALYNNTAGASWTNSTGWNGAVGTECTWIGVTCDGSGEHVTQINLSGNHLAGPLPPLSGLTSLRYFKVSNDQLTGTIPSLAGLTALEYFNAVGNKLTGAIPPLGGLTALEEFYVGGNMLTGAIPALGDLTALQLFEFSGNQLTGAIPPLSGLTALQAFYGRNNALTGAIPSLGGLTALIAFDVSGNQLTGAIPPLSGLTALQALVVDNNHLTGAIPALGDLTSLRFFYAFNNKLTGAIPPLGSLTVLEAFLVSDNHLSGPIPAPPINLSDSNLCGNSLTSSGDPAIDDAWAAASGDWLACQRSSQTISFGAQSAQVFGAAPFTLNPLATASSALTVIYSSATPAVCTVVGSSVTLLRPGTCSIAADQPGNPSFDPAPKVTQSFMVKGTLLSASRSKIGPKQAVTFTATVTGTSPTGSVNFREGANSIAGCASQPLIAGVATCNISTLSLGAHSIGAAYSGDGNNPGSHAQSINVTVQRSSLVPVLPLLMF